jgi:hypothetical protein
VLIVGSFLQLLALDIELVGWQFRIYIHGMFALAMASGVASTILAWRAARSTLGTFQYVLR